MTQINYLIQNHHVQINYNPLNEISWNTSLPNGKVLFKIYLGHKNIIC